MFSFIWIYESLHWWMPIGFSAILIYAALKPVWGHENGGIAAVFGAILLIPLTVLVIPFLVVVRAFAAPDERSFIAFYVFVLTPGLIPSSVAFVLHCIIRYRSNPQEL